MARAPYLTRREGGRYYLQIRLGKVAKALYGRKFLRASLRTSDYAEARRRLVDNLGWARELVDAPDLDARTGAPYPQFESRSLRQPLSLIGNLFSTDVGQR
ncbi:MAG: DUF6538 domain-containing protein [Xanthobacteraceae bacterium]